MGKIADRFAQKSNPLYAVANDIIKAARESIDDLGNFDPDNIDDELGLELDSILEAQLQTLSSNDFNKLKGLIYQNVELKQDGDELLSEIEDTLAFVCENQFSESPGVPNGFLIAVPMVILADTHAWSIALDNARCEVIAQAFRDYELVASDAIISFLPRLLSATEGRIMGFHEVYSLRRLMAAGDNREALRLVTSTRLANGIGFPRLTETANGSTTCGLLVAYVETSESISAFPLNAELNTILTEASELAETEEDVDGDESRQSYAMVGDAFTDVRTRLEAVATELLPVFGCEGLTFCESPGSWYAGVESCGNFERVTVAGLWLRKLSESMEAGDKDNLLFDGGVVISEEEPSLKMNFYTKDNAESPVGTLVWPALFGEDADDALLALQDFMERTGIPPMAP